VHTKGHKYSNSLDGQKRNSQVFIASALQEWLNTYEKIAVVVITLHLLKYPLGLFQFDYYRKFGIDMPNVAQVSFNLSLISSLLDTTKLEEIQNIANKDTQTKKLLSQLNAVPDKTDNEIEEQVIEFEKGFIKRYVGGFQKWEEDQLKFMNDLIAATNDRDNTDFKNSTLNRIEVIRKMGCRKTTSLNKAFSQHQVCRKAGGRNSNHQLFYYQLISGLTEYYSAF